MENSLLPQSAKATCHKESNKVNPMSMSDLHFIGILPFEPIYGYDSTAIMIKVQK